MSARKSSHRTIFLIVSSGSPLALIASSLRSTSKKPVCPMTRSFHPPMAHCNQRVRFAATWREEFFEVPWCDIPWKYTCEGEMVQGNLVRDVSPPLDWDGVPDGAKSLVLIMDDPDAPDPNAPQMVWVHWVVYNIPPDTKSLPENAARAGLPQGALHGLNDWASSDPSDPRATGYGGPCPPIGRHRYFHKLYALDITLDLRGAPATKSQIEQAMRGHVLVNAELIGTYQKRNP